jgi:CubicO group peptidase (beta-lactamase class C family)
MQLVERGELSIDDLLVDRLPWFAMADDRHREITIAQLLSHTSGMPDVDDYEWDRPQTDAAALKRWILELEDKELLFAPGTSRDYSNIGFEILGLVVQEVSATSFEAYMQSNIFDPLEMTDTSFIASEIDPALRVTGHFDSASRRAIAAYPYNRRHAPSSTLNTNIADMSKFAIAMLNGGQAGDAQLLKPDTIETMWTAAWQSPEDPSRAAALGWNIGRPWGGILAASHGGHDDGFRSYLFLAPEERVGIFLVSNDETISTREFVRAILEAVFPEQALSEANE